MNLSPKTLLYLNIALLFLFTFRFFSLLFQGFKTGNYSILTISILALALIFNISQIIKYSKIINNSDDK